MSPMRMDPTTAQRELTDHPHYKYRGCAADPDNPRLAAGDNALPVTAWQAPDVDGGEDQEARQAREDAAIEVCVGCPVMVQCLAYGSSLTEKGRLAEPYSILGGMTALQRHKAFVRERQVEPVVAEPAPDHELRTAQKLAVLRGLAVHADPVAVAAAAQAELRRELGEAYEFDVRTAKWQLARITTQLGLEKTATRAEVLEAAVARGLLRADEVAGRAPVPVASGPVRAARAGRRGGRGRRVAVVPGQLSFFDDALEVPGPAASVTDLFPSAAVLGAAA